MTRLADGATRSSSRSVLYSRSGGFDFFRLEGMAASSAKLVRYFSVQHKLRGLGRWTQLRLVGTRLVPLRDEALRSGRGGPLLHVTLPASLPLLARDKHERLHPRPHRPRQLQSFRGAERAVAEAGEDRRERRDGVGGRLEPPPACCGAAPATPRT